MATSTITITDGASTITLDNTVSTLTLGTSGPQGAPGEGVPVGGTTGQILAKDSATNYDTSWIDNFTTDVRVWVKNDAGVTLNKGTVVYISGANGTNILVKPAIASSDATSATTIGFLNETLANNASGYVITQGTITGIDTSAGSAGDPVWLSPTVAGGVVYGLANKPVAPNHLYSLGVLTRSNVNNGEISIFVNNGWELDELHNVKITSPVNGQVLAYNSTTQLWENTSETGDISSVAVTSPITGGGTSGAVTIGLNQGAITIAESQVTNLVTDLAGKVPTTRTLTAGTGLTGGGTLAADRTFTIDPAIVSYDASSSLRSLPLYNQKDAAEKLLAQAVFWIDAAHSSASGQTITNLGWGGSTLDATAGSTGSADSNDPKFLDWTGTNYVYQPGVSGNYLSVQDANALDIVGDIDIRIQIAMDDWTPASASSLFAKWTASGNQRSFRLDLTPAGGLQFVWSVDGITGTTANSTVNTSFADGATGWVRVTLDVDNGASGYTVTFYTSTDGTTWTQLGATVTAAGVTSIYSSTANVETGSLNAGTSQLSTMKVFKAQLLSGIGGTVVLNIDTSVITSGAATSFTALSGQTVTINRATSGRKTCVVTNPLWLFGTDDYIIVADNALLDFTLTESLTVIAIVRQWATQASKILVGKGINLVTAAGYGVFSGSVNDGVQIADGTNSVIRQSAFTAGSIMAVAGIRDTVADTVASNINGVITSTTDTTTATLENSLPLQAGTNADIEAISFAVFRRVLSTSEIALITNYYTTRVA